MKATYKVMQVTQSGALELAERATPLPTGNQVLIAVEACGICGADISDIEKANPELSFPRVPGHEVVGRIIAKGQHVSDYWQLGQRVGVGRLGGHCNNCQQCRMGQFQLCRQQDYVGATCDGGYAEMMLARETGLVSIPDELDSTAAAPLLCAGLATFNALKKCSAEAGDTIAVVGIGGLGHMALQYARRMGFRVIAIGRGSDIEVDAMALGAHRYVDTLAEDAVSVLQQLGGAQAIVSTISHAETVSSLFAGLAPSGRLVILGAGKDPLSVSAGLLVVGERSIMGSITGTPYENEKTLDFSVLTDIRPTIEVMPLAQANEAYQRMKSGRVKFRIALTP